MIILIVTVGLILIIILIIIFMISTTTAVVAILSKLAYACHIESQTYLKPTRRAIWTLCVETRFATWFRSHNIT
jgi:hypothetical protein